MYRFSCSVPVLRFSSSISAEQTSTNAAETVTDVFGGKKELTAFQSLVDSMSATVRLASSVVVVARGVAAGYGLGLRIGGNRNASLGAAVVLGVAGAGAESEIKNFRRELLTAPVTVFTGDRDRRSNGSRRKQKMIGDRLSEGSRIEIQICRW